MNWNIPNLLTVARILLIPVFVLLFFLPVPFSGLAAAIVFLLAAITDWLDGYMARRMGLTSPFGAFLDPVADKLMVVAALVLLVHADPRTVVTIPVLIIIGREITISALREWMAGVGNRTRVAVTEIGKIKTAMQMTAITLMIYHQDLFGIPVYMLGLALLYVAALLTLWSMILYIRAAWPSLSAGS